MAVGGEPALGQPPLKLGHLRLAASVDAVGQPGQLRIGESVAGEVGDRDVLEQVGDHVLHEPHIDLPTSSDVDPSPAPLTRPTGPFSGPVNPRVLSRRFSTPVAVSQLEVAGRLRFAQDPTVSMGGRCSWRTSSQGIQSSGGESPAAHLVGLRGWHGRLLLLEPMDEVIGWRRSADVVALDRVAAKRVEFLQGLGILDPLGDHPQAKVAAEVDGGVHDHRIAGAAGHLGHK